MFNLQKLNEVGGKYKHNLELSNRFSALQTLDTEVDIKRSWGKNYKNKILTNERECRLL